MKLSKVLYLSWALIFAAVVLGLAGGILKIDILVYIALFPMAAALIVTLLFWKCPHCGARLPRGLRVYDRCPRCGKELDF